MNKILITGAAGLIGSTLVERLAKHNYEIISCDIRLINNPLSFYSKQIIPLLNECIGIIHLAAISRVIHGEQCPDLCNKVNVEETTKFLELYKVMPHKPWFIYGSSREVYGEQSQLPVTESASLNPVNNYANGKVLIEEFIADLENTGFNVAVLRFSNVYGGLLDHYNRVVPAFCINALKNEPIRIEGQGCVFDFTYLEDAVDGISLAVNHLQNVKSSLPPIHFTTNRPCSLGELANLILKLTNSHSKIDIYPARNFDVSCFYGDFSRAKELLNWSPKHSLEQGLNKFIENLKNGKKACPKNLDMVIYENIDSYSWLPALL
ncbi:MAG: NAD-dependent epimerase/dehydratase family protein [Rickettsia conorii subsp. raoultii]|uniref:Epimerase n=3 Tax=Rickettsia conorii TaxID=781 RepID=A0A9N7BVP2_RICCR|nr:NAD(P)-dependent oxidoreductase [Rickettsia conorii]AJQ52460.1 epimerase [Rickettsia conorii subsp. raoultii]